MMPFAGGIDSTANGTLVLSVALAGLYLAMVAAPSGWRRTVAKAGSILLLAVLAFVEGGSFLLVAALLFCAAGDAFLAQPGERAFLAGLASFLAGHIAYAALFATGGDGAAAIAAAPLRLVLAAVMLVSAAGMAAMLSRRVPAAMALPVRVYVIAIAAMGLAALTTGSAVLVAGALLFMLSDAILSAERYLLPADGAHRRWSQPAVWVTYYSAQLALTLGVLTAR